MNSLILITAMTATSGLFGGKHCGQPKHHAKKVATSCYSSAPCGTTYATPYASHQAMAVPSAQAQPMAPPKMAPPTSSVPPAPPAVPTPSPSSALAPTGQPIVATGDLR